MSAARAGRAVVTGWIILLCLLCSRTARAQRIRGVVMMPDSTTPAAGVIVEARDAQARVVSQGLTNEDGAFQLDLPAPGQADLRVLRVGFQVTAGPRLTVSAGEITTARVILGGEQVPLANVAISTNRQCRIDAAAGQLISVVWTEARKALESTQLNSPDGAVRAHWSVSDESTDLKETLVLSENTVDEESPSSHPFASLPPDSLARVGYVAYQRGVNSFTAPDANVLLSDSFARTHCFQLVKKHPQHPDWIGVAFSPAQDRRGFSDIVGTLWVERANAELRRIDYQYTELPPQVERAAAGGWVEFLHLASGTWFVSRWSIRMPRTARYDNRDWTPGAFERDVVATSRLVVDAVQTRTGEVRSIQRNDGVLLFAAATGSMLGAAADSTEPSTTLCGGVNATSRFSMMYGRVLDSSSQPVANVAVDIEWQDNSQCAISGECSFDDHRHASTTNENGSFWFCGVPSGYPIVLTAERRGNFRRRMTTEVPADKRIARIDVPVYWP